MTGIQNIFSDLCCCRGNPVGNGLDLIFSPVIMTLLVMGFPLYTYVSYLKHRNRKDRCPQRSVIEINQDLWNKGASVGQRDPTLYLGRRYLFICVYSDSNSGCQAIKAEVTHLHYKKKYQLSGLTLQGCTRILNGRPGDARGFSSRNRERNPVSLAEKDAASLLISRSVPGRAHPPPWLSEPSIYSYK